jgi:anti-sigma factor (TIGR02949 family)
MTEAWMAVPCREAVMRLWEYLDGELSGPDAPAVAQHLESCRRCWPHTDFQRAYQRFLAQTADMPVPPGLRRKVFEALLAEESGGDRPPSTDSGGPSAPPRWNVLALLGRIFRRS